MTPLFALGPGPAGAVHGRNEAVGVPLRGAEVAGVEGGDVEPAEEESHSSGLSVGAAAQDSCGPLPPRRVPYLLTRASRAATPGETP